MGGGALVLALLLYLLFPFGLGGDGSDGETEGDADAQGDAMVTSAPANSPFTSLTGDPPSPAMSDEEQKALSGNVLTVLIDEHKYLIEIPTDQAPLYRPTPLTRIVELAQLAEGDANGIRVRVLRRDSARASAEEKLRLELNHSDIRNDAIYMSDTTVP